MRGSHLFAALLQGAYLSICRLAASPVGFCHPPYTVALFGIAFTAKRCASMGLAPNIGWATRFVPVDTAV